MSHFAKLDENNVVVLVVRGRQEDDGQELALSERTGDTYKQTSYNTAGGIYFDSSGEFPVPHVDQTRAFRKNFASIGFTYDSTRDAFIPPKPSDGNWQLDEQTCQWVEVTE